MLCSSLDDLVISLFYISIKAGAKDHLCQERTALGVTRPQHSSLKTFAIGKFDLDISASRIDHLSIWCKMHSNLGLSTKLLDGSILLPGLCQVPGPGDRVLR